jgi:hypothetical protein
MAMTYYERKALLPHGAVSRVAEDAGCAPSKVSAVLSGRVRDRDVEARLSRLMRKADGSPVSVVEAFGPPARKLHKKAAPLMEVA